MEDRNTTEENTNKQKKFFWLRNPILKVLLCIALYALGGGLILIAALIGFAADYLLTKRKKKMQKIISACVAALTLAGCAGSTVETGIPRFVGKDISYAIKYLGYPDEEVNVAGKKVYVWQDAFSRTGTFTSYRPQYITTYAPNGMVASNSITVQEDTPVTINGECKIRLITSKERVVETALEGNDFGCGKYVDKVQKLIDDTEPKVKKAK